MRSCADGRSSNLALTSRRTAGLERWPTRRRRSVVRGREPVHQHAAQISRAYRRRALTSVFLALPAQPTASGQRAPAIPLHAERAEIDQAGWSFARRTSGQPKRSGKLPAIEGAERTL